MNPKPLTFAQVAARADRKVKALDRKRYKALYDNDKVEVTLCCWDIHFWRGVAACARYFKTGENNLGL